MPGRIVPAAFVTMLCAAAFPQTGLAQTPLASILTIDVANQLLYDQDTSDVTRYATNPNVTPDSHSAKNFARAVGVADVVAVNGQPVGLMSEPVPKPFQR